MAISLLLAAIFAPAMVVAVAATRLARWKPVLTEPRCVKCGYDLRGVSATPPTRCSECGADLTTRHAIQWGSFQRRSKWVVTGAILPLVILMLLVSAFVPIYRRAQAPVVMSFSSSRSNSEVLTSLAIPANQPIEWAELQRRLQANTLSKAETVQAIDALITTLQNQTTPQPLSWSSGFIKSADAAGDISDEQFVRLAQAFHGPITVSLPKKVRAGNTAQFTVHAGCPWQLPGLDFVKAMREVRLADGQKIPCETTEYHPRDPAGPDALSANFLTSIWGSVSPKLTAGNYVLTFVVDAGLLPQGTAPQLVDGRKPGQADKWPVSKGRWTSEITRPLTVIPADQSPIELLTDTKLDPHAAIAVNTARVTLDAKGLRLAVEFSVRNSPIACCFQTSVRFNGTNYSLGEMLVAAAGTIKTSPERVIPSLPADLSAVDIVLTPDASFCEGRPEFDRIWGSPILIKRVPLHRFDLEAGREQPAEKPPTTQK